MCEACEGSPNLGERPPAAPVSRRRILAMGVSAAAGVVVGLWSCQKDGVREGTAGTRNATREPVAGAQRLTMPSPTDTQSNIPSPRTAVAETRGTATEVAESDPAATRAITGAPDLGSEVFPDPRGMAIAKPTDAPVIVVPRANWAKGGPNLKQVEVMGGIERITVHHTAGEIQTDAWVPTAGELESIREFHSGTRTGDRHWADIAYHFAVDRAGRVWQARPLAYQGAHVKGHNEHNMGIVLLGNFEVQSPSAAQLSALRDFVGFVRGLYGVKAAELYTHGELGDTSCPGKTLQAFMDRWRKS